MIFCLFSLRRKSLCRMVLRLLLFLFAKLLNCSHEKNEARIFQLFQQALSVFYQCRLLYLFGKSTIISGRWMYYDFTK